MRLVISIFLYAWSFYLSVARRAIVGGERARVDQFPYQVAVMDNMDVICGGAIIDDYFILTAAHCVLQTNGEFYEDHTYIIAGTNDLKKHTPPAVTNLVVKIYVPVEFINRQAPADIAVLKLKFSLDMSKRKNLKRVELPKDAHDTYMGETAKIAGYGWQWAKFEDNVEIGGNNDTYLHFADAEILDHCHKHYFQRARRQHEICARIKHHDNSHSRGTCVHDSGGALVVNDSIAIGILTLGPMGCSEKEGGAVYTRVTHYLKFIDDAIHDRPISNMRTYEP